MLYCSEAGWVKIVFKTVHLCISWWIKKKLCEHKYLCRQSQDQVGWCSEKALDLHYGDIHFELRSRSGPSRGIFMFPHFVQGNTGNANEHRQWRPHSKSLLMHHLWQPPFIHTCIISTVETAGPGWNRVPYWCCSKAFYKPVWRKLYVRVTVHHW